MTRHLQELGDKTQLATLLFATDPPNPEYSGLPDAFFKEKPPAPT
jgi:hypothetical protein